MVPRVLAIAGSDPSGGAGIQADLKTYAAFGVYGMTAITALTVQNTVGVTRVVLTDPAVVREQIRACLDDIGVDAIKIGMLGSAAIIRAVAEEIRSLPVPIVVDPVMRAKGGDPLLEPEAEDAFRETMVPLATVITPNLPEAEALLGFPVRDRVEMRRAARALAHQGVPAVLIKGGHLTDDQAADLLWYQAEENWLTAPRIQTHHTHGTGCTLSSAIAAGLARGEAVAVAVAEAKRYVTKAIQDAPGLGHGHGPLWHHGWVRP